MKKVVSIIIASIYLALASGVLINLHFCGGHIKKVTFFHVADEEGCCGSAEESMGCCSDAATFIKIKDDHNSNNALKVVLSHAKPIEFVPLELTLNLKPEFVPIKQNYKHPPVFYEDPIFLQNRVLLI